MNEVGAPIYITSIFLEEIATKCFNKIKSGGENAPPP
jgi:hypothetical protein